MSERTIELDKLLAPITEDAPCGRELDRSDSRGSFYRVKNLRDEAVASESAHERAALGGLSDAERENLPPPPNWGAVVAAASEIIAGESKDFRVACWLAEGLLRLHGPRGLGDGLALCRGLCERHWANLFPPPNEDGHLDTVAPLAGLTGSTAAQVLKLYPITPAPNGRAYSLWDYKQASGGKGDFSTTDIEASAATATPDYYPQLLAAIEEGIESLKWLGDFLHENAQPDSYGEPSAPSLSGLRTELEDARRVVRALGGGGAVDADNSTQEGVSGGAAEVVEGSDGASGVAMPSITVPAGAITSRAEAFKRLGKVAEFFDKTEPHSPVPYALRQVIGWGRMSLPELLRELISDQNVREDLQRRVGVPLDESSDG